MAERKRSASDPTSTLVNSSIVKTFGFAACRGSGCNLRWSVLLLVAVIAVLPAGAAPLFDRDASGFGDVWELVYGVNGLVPGEDDDGDGWTNAQEFAAGSDPNDSESVPPIVRTTMAGPDVVVSWDSRPGKRYTLFAAGTLVAPDWTPIGDSITATGVVTELSVPDAADEPQQFFQVTVADVDTDSDGVPDWDELRVGGFDPAVAQSAVPGQSDRVSLTQRLDVTGNTVSLTIPVSDAYEKEQVAARIQIRRTGSLQAITAKIAITGNADVQKGSASGVDYTLESSVGSVSAGAIEIPFGVEVVDVLIRPVLDARNEVPETLNVTLLADPDYLLGAGTTGAVVIRDAANTDANRRLFAAYLRPQDGVVSQGSGFSTVILNGDNTIGLLDLAFGGLSAPQFQAHIRVEATPGGTGPVITNLPRGTVSDFAWSVRAAQFLTTDQATLDALFSGQLYVSVASNAAIEGELRGDYALTDGSFDAELPDAPPPIAALSGEARTRDVARFLTQATFGPKPGEVEALDQTIDQQYGGDRIAAFSAWIDQQFADDQTNQLDYVYAADGQEWAQRGTTPTTYIGGNQPGTSNRRRAWWTISTQANDQLRQRAAFALSEIFVISEFHTEVRTRHYGAANYYDILATYASGNFRDLLGAVSRSPMMGVYLSHLKNQKAVVDPATGSVLISPDENYAREVMQLFSIGLVKLRLDGALALTSAGKPEITYDNDDITELARVLTGWSFSKGHGALSQGYPVIDNQSFTRNNGPSYFQASWLNPMKNFPAFHDTGAKTVLGQPIPAGLNGEQDLDAALEILFRHPNVAPFISRRLIQRFVTSTPSAGYVYRVAQAFEDDGTGTRGNLRAVIKAILLDPEARDLAKTNDPKFGKQKEPIIRYIQFLRAFGGVSQLPLADLGGFGLPPDQIDNFPMGVTRYRYGETDNVLGQTPLKAPTVFNWFLPDYAPGGAIAAAGIFAPEMQISTENQVVEAVNYHRSLVFNGTGQSTAALFGATDQNLDNVQIDRAPWDAMYNAQVAAGKTPREAITVVVDALDLLLTAGNLKAKYAGAPTPNPRESILVAGTNSTGTDRIRNVIYLFAASPEYLHQK